MNNPLAMPLIQGSENSYPPAARGWLYVALLMSLYIVSLLDRNALVLLLGPVQRDLALSDLQVSLLLGLAFAVFYSLASLPIGAALDRFSRRHVIFICVVIWSLGTMACGFAGSFLTLFIARMVIGGGEAAISPGSQSILADSFPPSRLGLPMSIFSLGAQFGLTISFLITGALTALIDPTGLFTLPFGFTFKGWQLIFLAIGAPGLLCALLIYVLPEPPRLQSATAGMETGTYRECLRYLGQHRRLVLTALIGIVLFLAAWLGVVSWTPAHFQRTFGWSPAQTGTVLGFALALGPIVGAPLHGWLVDRYFRRSIYDIHLRYLATTALLSVPVGVAAFLIPHAWVSVALIGLFFFLTCTCGSMPLIALQILIPAHLRGKAAALMMLCAVFPGTALGPLTVALFTDWFFHDPGSIRLSIATTIGLLLPLAGVAFVLACKPMRRAVASNTAGRL